MNSGEFLKYLTNKASDKEKEAFYASLQKNKPLEKEFLDARKVWDLAQLNNVRLSTKRKKQLFEEFWQRSHQEIPREKRLVTVFLRYAAIVVLILAIPVFYYLGRNKTTVSHDMLTTITCAPGDKSSVVLPDGSEVCLNSGSTIVFPNDFGNGQRQIRLEGEAFFSVRKNPKVPFVVEASEIEVEVLGTDFNLKAYPEESEILATLVEGRLKVTSESESKMIMPNEKLVYNRSSRKMVQYRLSDTSPETEWKEGRFVFRNESLADLELEMERWFDVDIEFADEEVKTRRFTGILERESILETISYFGISKYVDYKIDGNLITFYSAN